jgi:hypothetical protein
MATTSLSDLLGDYAGEPWCPPEQKPRDWSQYENRALLAHGHETDVPTYRERGDAGACPFCDVWLATNASWVVNLPVAVGVREPQVNRFSGREIVGVRRRAHARCFITELERLGAQLPAWAGTGTDY